MRKIILTEILKRKIMFGAMLLTNDEGTIFPVDYFIDEYLKIVTYKMNLGNEKKLNLEILNHESKELDLIIDGYSENGIILDLLLNFTREKKTI